MTNPKILAFAGSTRAESYNHRLLSLAADLAEAEGAEVRRLRLNDLELPLFDEDFERDQGPPAGATQFKEWLIESHGMLIASPEYNSSITAVLKNAIDWASWPAEGEPPLVAFRGKAAGLVSASPGGLGGMRGLVHLRAILGNIGVMVVPEQVSVNGADKAFGSDMALTREADQKRLQATVSRLVTVSRWIAEA